MRLACPAAIAAAVTKFDTEPQLLATALRDQLGEAGVATLLALLGGRESAPADEWRHVVVAVSRAEY